MQGAGYDFATQPGGIGETQYYLNIFLNSQSLYPNELAREMDEYGITPSDVVEAYRRYSPGTRLSLEDVIESYYQGGGRNQDYLNELPSAITTVVPSWFDKNRFSGDLNSDAAYFNELLNRGYPTDEIREAFVVAFGGMADFASIQLRAAGLRSTQNSASLLTEENVEELEEDLREQEAAAAAAAAAAEEAARQAAAQAAAEEAARQAAAQAAAQEAARIAAAQAAAEAAAAQAAAQAAIEQARTQAEAAAAATAKAKADIERAQAEAAARAAAAAADAAARAAAEAAARAGTSPIPEYPRLTDIAPQQTTGGNAGLLLAAGLAALTLLG